MNLSLALAGTCIGPALIASAILWLAAVDNC
jgi:hypothetical protein